MAQVFISYSRKDLRFVRRLVKDLKDAGLAVWQDKSQIKGGEIWPKEIEDGIEKSQYVIAVLSPDSVDSKSKWVGRELLFAEEHNRQIIPLLYRSCDVPITLQDVQYIDVQGKNYEKNFHELLDALHVDVTKRSAADPTWPSKLHFGMPTRHLALIAIGLVAAFLVGAAIWFIRPHGASESTQTPPPVMTTQPAPSIPATTEPAPTNSPITESPPSAEPPTTEPPPTDPPPTEPPTQPPTTEPLSSAYTSNPPSIDGAMTKAHWKDALMAHALPLGSLYYLNDDHYLYLLVDLPGDKDNNLHGKQSYDDLLLVFDVDKDGNRDTNDVYYRFWGKGSKFEFCTWLAPVPAVECDVKKRDRSMTSWLRPGFNISPQFLDSRHKFWESRIDLDEIKGRLGDVVYTGVATSQDGMSLTSINSMPQVSDFSPDAFDFGHLVEIYLHEEPPAP